MLLGADGKVRHPQQRRARAGADAPRSVAGGAHWDGLRSLRLRPPRAAFAQKNGEKRLRSLLVKTSEWKNESQRAAVVRSRVRFMRGGPRWRPAVPAAGRSPRVALLAASCG